MNSIIKFNNRFGKCTRGGVRGYERLCKWRTRGERGVERGGERGERGASEGRARGERGASKGRARGERGARTRGRTRAAIWRAQKKVKKYLILLMIGVMFWLTQKVVVGGVASIPSIFCFWKKNIRSIKTIFLVGSLAPRAQAVPIRFYQTPRKNKKQRPNNFWKKQPMTHLNPKSVCFSIQALFAPHASESWESDIYQKINATKTSTSFATPNCETTPPKKIKGVRSWKVSLFGGPSICPNPSRGILDDLCPGNWLIQLSFGPLAWSWNPFIMNALNRKSPIFFFENLTTKQHFNKIAMG